MRQSAVDILIATRMTSATTTPTTGSDASSASSSGPFVHRGPRTERLQVWAHLAPDFRASGFAEHGTHHAEPGLPYYHLPAATNELAKGDPERVANHQYLVELAVMTGIHPLHPPAGESK